MKKLFKIVLGLLTLLALFVGIWLGVNLWPRKLEPPLWTEADLAIPEEKEKNGYYYFIQISKGPLLSGEAVEIPDLLYEVDYYIGEGRAQFWEKVKEWKPNLSTFIQEKKATIQEYQKILEFPQFIDASPIAIDPLNHPPWMSLLGLHRIGILYVAGQILEGNRDTACAFWLKMFQMDQSWTSSARGMISQMVAIRTLKEDLGLLSFMSDLPPSKESEKIIQAFQNFDPEKFNFRRALIFTYLFSLAGEDYITSGKPLGFAGLKGKIDEFILVGTFNRALHRRDINVDFRKLEALVEHPEAISERTVEQFSQDKENITKSWFRWFYNPFGNLTRQASFMIAGQIQRFYAAKEELRKIRSQLLAQPLFPPGPETLPAHIEENTLNWLRPEEVIKKKTETESWLRFKSANSPPTQIVDTQLR